MELEILHLIENWVGLEILQLFFFLLCLIITPNFVLFLFFFLKQKIMPDSDDDWLLFS